MIKRPKRFTPHTALLLLTILLFSSYNANALSTSQYSTNLSLNGTAFQDVDANGFFSAGETGIANVTIRLIKGDAEIALAVSNETGQYSFANLSPGSYLLAANPVPGGNLTAPADGRYEVTLSDQPGFRLDYGVLYPSKLMSSPPEREHPLMHPTKKEVNLWTGQYRTSAQAYLSPTFAARFGSEPPKSFSLLDMLEYRPSERDQGTCGNCWAWAGTGVMEVDYARQKGLPERFSVQYLDSNFNGGCGNDGACCGGWLEDLADFYQKKKIIVPWSNANAYYRDGTKSCGACSAVSASSISTTPHHSLASISASAIPTHGLDEDTAIDNIKNILLQKKAIWFAFFLPDSSSWSNFNSFWANKPQSTVWRPGSSCGRSYSYQSGGGHAVLCVGYNDSDPNNRYWIMLNSWGTTDGRPDGLFYVNMDMDYDCSYTDLGYAFYWMTLNISYDAGENHPPQTPDVPQGLAVGSVASPLSYTSSTTDSDGDSVSLTFNWSDGTTTETRLLDSGQEGTASHAWSKAGSYQVSTMATDSNGASSSWSDGLSVNIIEANDPPSRPSTPTGPSSGRPGQSCQFTSSATDPDGDDIQITFDWGDGSLTTSEFFGTGTAIGASHTWSKAGTYSVRARAIDIYGRQSGWSATRKVRIAGNMNHPPNTPSSPTGVSRGQSGKSYSFIGYTTDIDQDQIRYTFDWADGSSTDSSLIASGKSAKATHSWGEVGTYEVRIMATDSNGGKSGWSASKKVTVTKATRPVPRASAKAASQQSGTKKSCPCQDD